MGRVCSTYEDNRGACRVLVEKPDGRKLFGRPKHRWNDNIKMDLAEVGWGGMVWIDLTQDMDSWRALVSAVINLRFP
jgi:hypothetical protein